MVKWERHITCGVEIKDYFVLTSDDFVICSVFLNGNDEWILKRNDLIDICDSRSQAFDFAEATGECEGIKRLRNRRV